MFSPGGVSPCFFCCPHQYPNETAATAAAGGETVEGETDKGETVGGESIGVETVRGGETVNVETVNDDGTVCDDAKTVDDGETVGDQTVVNDETVRSETVDDDDETITERRAGKGEVWPDRLTRGTVILIWEMGGVWCSLASADV